MTFLFLGDMGRAAKMRAVFAAEAPDIAFHDRETPGDAATVRYLATWTPPADLASRHPGLELVFSTGAGVDQFDMGLLPPQVSVVRLVEKHLIDGMVEYVCAAALSLHRDFFAYARAQRGERWQELPVLLAPRRRISILGAGELGRGVIAGLAPFGFPLSAWSRSPRTIEHAAHYSGDDGLTQMLAATDILVCLLPLTAQTTGVLCRDLFAKLPRGACLINVGRGGHLVENDLLAALDDGQLSQAVLDVTAPEPLPAGHPFWQHPRILLTPHIASVTDPAMAARAMIANIRRHREGLAPEGLVRRDMGY
ncbi:glyoxylate/hydroxypyruvate reductase A [Novosphingobium sp. P6W]|uniref:2-hydroxyacid dehydrogenase n=1 Tax=Novosphingobium sp. P6W TaxID=1609758 RepID=UPI0005C2FD2B|nr:glyoxylate/hydroxypyruvate reductase A [Novosphingobium sp. P6W]AXB78429.1 glyoxylate/hydroxypyruvate reductase A [Novosphingobium sp. P6W]KIS32366.1 2-hydroxyacid dehydrogenase [Novosphingobium sp. P6W]